MDEALTYTTHQALELESSYPYTAQDGTCSYDGTGEGFFNGDRVDVPYQKPN